MCNSDVRAAVVRLLAESPSEPFQRERDIPEGEV
jgi:hypothetical protein